MKKLTVILSMIFISIFFINGCSLVKGRYETSEVQTIYSDEVQSEFLAQVIEKKNSKNYTIDKPLYIVNPFKTNTTSIYLYFKTEELSRLEYTVHVDDENISDFTRTLYNEGENNLTREHEYNLIGLIGGKKNIITLNLYNSDNELIGTKILKVKVPEVSNIADKELIKEEGDSTSTLSEGLFVTLGHINSGEYKSYIYDNDGIIRGEINLDSYRIDRILFKDDLMYVSTGINKISALNRLGYAERTYDLGKYELHHDYVFGKDNSLIILASNPETGSIEDLIIKLDLETGEVTELIDLGNIFGELKKTGIIATEDDKVSLDWIHINSISFVNDTDIIISARETSTIIKIDDIYTNPKIGYMIGSYIPWEGTTSYSNYFLTKNGDFVINGGQHSVEVVHDDSLGENQYYIDLFNNNLGYSGSRPDVNWSQIEGINGDVSMYYRYLVDENNKTFTLIDSLEVVKSDYISNIQSYDGHLIVDSGNDFSFAEYDSDKNLIARFRLEQEMWGLYRCYKENFSDFYFYEE